MLELSAWTYVVSSGRVLPSLQVLLYVQPTSAELSITPADPTQMSAKTCTFPICRASHAGHSIFFSACFPGFSKVSALNMDCF